MTDQRLSLIIQGILALVLIIGMVWVIVTPFAGDEATKAALAILGATTGFIFGRTTSVHGEIDVRRDI